MTATTIRVQMAQRSDTAANWTAANPILLSGEIGYETDTEKFKIGDGTTNWNGLAYLPIPDGSGNLTITGNLEIGTTGTLTFEGSTADGFETTLAVTDPTADRTITLPDVSGTVVTTGDTGSVTSAMLADGTIVDADVSATAEIAVSKLANGTANQVLVTDGTDVNWSDDLTLAGNLTVNGTTTTVNTQTLVVEDKNIELGVVDTPTDLTADGGGITLKGTTDKTINWVDATDSWTSSEHVDLASGKSYRINGTEVLSGTTLGSGVTGSSLTSVGTLGSLTVTGDLTVDTNTLYVDSTNNRVGLGTSAVTNLFHVRSDSASAVDHVYLQNRNGGASSGARIAFSNGAVDYADNRYAYIGALNTGAAENGNVLVFATNANGQAPVERMRLTATGLGVGTTTPQAPLSISNGGANGIEIYSNYAGTGQSGIVSYNRSTSQRTDLYISTDETIFVTSGSERCRLDASGRLLVGTPSDSGGALLQVNGDRIRVGTAKTPASATATGTAGEICWDASYVYVCTATNTWKRSALSTW